MACPDCNANASEAIIYYHSLINRHGESFVHICWGGLRGQLTPDETRTLALHLLESAEAAEQDHVVWRLLTEKIGIAPDQAPYVIGDLRKYRTEK